MRSDVRELQSASRRLVNAGRALRGCLAHAWWRAAGIRCGNARRRVRAAVSGSPDRPAAVRAEPSSVDQRQGTAASRSPERPSGGAAPSGRGEPSQSFSRTLFSAAMSGMASANSSLSRQFSAPEECGAGRASGSTRIGQSHVPNAKSQAGGRSFGSATFRNCLRRELIKRRLDRLLSRQSLLRRRSSLGRVLKEYQSGADRNASAAERRQASRGGNTWTRFRHLRMASRRDGCRASTSDAFAEITWPLPQRRAKAAHPSRAHLGIYPCFVRSRFLSGVRIRCKGQQLGRREKHVMSVAYKTDTEMTKSQGPENICPENAVSGS